MSRGPPASLIQPGGKGPRPTNQHMRSSTDFKPAPLVLERGGHLALSPHSTPDVCPEWPGRAGQTLS